MDKDNIKVMILQAIKKKAAKENMSKFKKPEVEKKTDEKPSILLRLAKLEGK